MGPIIFAILLSTVCIWSLHVKFSSVLTPKKFIEDSRSTVNTFIFKFGSCSEILSEWILLFLTFNHNFLALRQLLILLSSLLIYSSKTLMSLCEKKWLVSLANMIGLPLNRDVNHLHMIGAIKVLRWTAACYCSFFSRIMFKRNKLFRFLK